MKKTFLLFAALLCTTLAGQTIWNKIPSGTIKRLNTVDFPSSNVGYIGADDSTLLKSMDGGLTWNPVTFTGVTFKLNGSHILDLDFINDTTGYMIIGPYGGAYKTTDGGNTWSQLTPAGPLCFFHSLYFFDAQNGFVGGSGCFQGEMIDNMSAGTFTNTVIQFPTNSAADMVVDIDFLNTSFGLAASKGGNILRTTDGGQTWDSIATGKAEHIPLTSVAVINNTLAYAGYDAAGSGYGVLHSTDGGLTWTDDPNAATFFYPAIFCLHEAGNGKVYAGGRPIPGPGGLILEGTAGLWTNAAVGQRINDITSISNNVVIAVGDSGYIAAKVLPADLRASERSDLNRLTVYPNPADDELNIAVPGELESTAATLVIYSVYGQIVHIASYNAKQALQLPALSTGAYIVEFTAGTYTQRTVFMKN